jgi:phenylacetate-CoA ligase
MNQAQFAADHARQGRSPNDHVALIAPRIPEHDGQHLAVPPNHWLGSGQIHLRSSEKTDALGHAQWLASLGAQYLSLTPQLLSGLLEVFEDGKLKPVGFKQVLTHGQAVDRLLRERTQATFGAQIRDRYTLEEVGLVAVQCPHSSAHWHTAVSNVMVEAVKADGKPVKDGEAGRILVTGLHQFASAVVRYDTGDWATFHHECPACGATVPTLSRLIGVPRLWLVTPSGQRLRPRLTAAHWRAVGPVVEHRLVQIASNQVQCQITAERRLDEAELQAAQTMLTQVVSPEFTYQVVQHAAIDWPTGVKRLDVENLLLG